MSASVGKKHGNDLLILPEQTFRRGARLDRDFELTVISH